MKKIGWIYLLPSETLKVIVKYHPKWMISAVIANTSKKIKTVKRLYDEHADEVDERDILVKIPDLIMSHSMQKPWVSNSKIETYFSINAIDLQQTSGIYVIPYRLANVYSSSNICFGDIALERKPSNLRQANNFFWASPFNEDNCPYLDKHLQICEERNHDHYDEKRIREQYESESEKLDVLEMEERIQANCACCFNECACPCTCDTTDLYYDWLNNYYELLKNQKYTLSTTLFCGERYFAVDTPTCALFLSNHLEALSKVPEKMHRLDCQNTKVVIGAAKPSKDGWTVDFGGHSIDLTNEETEVI